jgi:hypothetical protein
MRKLIFVAFILLIGFVNFSNEANAQSLEYDLKVGIPIPVGDTFLSQYDGIFSSEVAIGYPIGKDYSVYVGMEYQRLNFELTDVDANITSPRVGIKKNFFISNRVIIVPDVSLGYSRFDFKLNSDIEEDFSLNGLSLGLGITPKYEITDKWNLGVSVRYVATFMELGEGVKDTAFNKEYHVISPGIITTFKF